MEKLFKFQKIMFVVYIITAVAIFTYALGFMTQYSELKTLILSKNQHLIDFHDELQAFNKTIFWLTLGGVASILVIFILELNKKVQDLFGVIVTAVFALLNVIASLLIIIRCPQFKSEWLDMDVSGMSLEYTKYTDEILFEKGYVVFNIGPYIAAFVIVVMITYVTIITVNHVKMRGEGNA